MLLVGLINIIDEGLCDHAFVADNAVGFDSLEAGGCSIHTDFVARRADVAADKRADAARTFGRGSSRRGLLDWRKLLEAQQP